MKNRGFYWYENDPSLYKAEVLSMRKFFPTFTIHQLEDGSGRLYWRGTVQPTGKNGIEWDLILIYRNDHPSASIGDFGGSIQILPLKPRLKDIADNILPYLVEKYGSYDKVCDHNLGLGLPHIYRGNFGRNEEYFICTADPKCFKQDRERSTSAASALAWACKWIVLCEMWINGEIGDEVAMDGEY